MVVPGQREDIFSLVGRGGYLLVQDHRIELHVPSIFARRSLDVEPIHTAVVDFANAADTQARPPTDLVARTQMAIIPTTLFRALKTPANIALLFTEPVELPAVRLLALVAPTARTLQKSRRPTGRTVNGVFLTAMDPQAAVARLVQNGVTQLKDPQAWVEKHWLR